MDDVNLARQAERALDRHGDYDSLYFEGGWHSSGAQADRAARFATGLTSLGLRPGDRLLVLMANCPEVLVTYLAAWRAGAAVTPLIFLVTDHELRAALIDSGAVGVVTTAEFLPKVLGATAGAPEVKFIVSVGAPMGAPAGAPAGEDSPVPVHDFGEVESEAPGSIVARSGTDLAALLYTGGTTGRAKGVPLSHANLNWCGWSVDLVSAASRLDSHLVPLPLAHAYGLLVLCAGMHKPDRGQTFLMRWFDPAGWVKLAAEHRIQASALVPSMIQMLLTQPLEETDLSALAAVSSGAAPLPAEVRTRFEARIPSVTIYEGYGCTESATIISASPAGRRRPGAVGLPVPGCEVSVRDDKDQELGVGEDGEICVRSPGVMSGYWAGAGAGADGGSGGGGGVLAGGWLHTGDIGHVDLDGYLYVVDRKKDLILRSGFNVFPRDVEEILLTHPAVAQAGVIGRPDQRVGEEVVAFVSLRPGVTTSSEELIEHAKLHLSRVKYPREVRIVPAMPLTSVGKLDRKKLREWLAGS